MVHANVVSLQSHWRSHYTTSMSMHLCLTFGAIDGPARSRLPNLAVRVRGGRRFHGSPLLKHSKPYHGILAFLKFVVVHKGQSQLHNAGYRYCRWQVLVSPCTSIYYSTIRQQSFRPRSRLPPFVLSCGRRSETQVAFSSPIPLGESLYQDLPRFSSLAASAHRRINQCVYVVRACAALQVYIRK